MDFFFVYMFLRVYMDDRKCYWHCAPFLYLCKPIPIVFDRWAFSALLVRLVMRWRIFVGALVILYHDVMTIPVGRATSIRLEIKWYVRRSQQFLTDKRKQMSLMETDYAWCW